MWFDDSIWRAAATACLERKDEFDWILTPAEFHGLSPNFRPIEYSECPPPGRVAFLCHKDCSDNLATAFRQAAAEPGHYLFANDVFVLGSVSPMGETDPAWREHLPSWFNRAGGKIIPPREQPFFHTEIPGDNASKKKALLIGATSFGNVGDDLLGEAAARLLLDSGEFGTVHLAGFDLRRRDLESYDAVFIGAGGLLYATQPELLEWQNLGNYFKFPFWCEEKSIPCHLLAVGHQEQGLGLEHDEPSHLFAKASLRRFQSMTVRDQETAALLRRLTGRTATVGADLVFRVAAAVPAPGEPSATGTGVLLVGEIFRYPAFGEWLQSEAGRALLLRSRVAYGLMSTEDLRHFTRLRDAGQANLPDLEIHDFRGKSGPAIVETMRGYDLLLSTRFHGMVLGLIAGLKPVAFDQHGGKKDRLVRSIFPELARQVLFAESTAADLGALLDNGADKLLHRVEPGKIRAHALTAENHLPKRRTQARRSSFRLPDERRRELARRLLTPEGEIKLCWAASGPETRGYANLGDALSAYLIANLAGRAVRHTNFDEETDKLVGVGSIGHVIRRGHAVIWGTGCYRPDKLIDNVKDTTFEVLCVRGNISRDCLEAVGIPAPACYGEPAWLLPAMFQEKIEKKYELGIISHISDLKTTGPDAAMKDEWVSFEIPDLLKQSVIAINTWHEAGLEGLLAKLRLILSCKRIASRSFHGTAIAETYGIPCLPVCSKPGVPQGAFSAEQVQLALLDRRTVEFLNHGTRRPQFFYGQRRNNGTDWENLMATIDRLWSPLGYDATPMLEAFPFDIPVDPTHHRVPTQPSLSTLSF